MRVTVTLRLDYERVKKWNELRKLLNNFFQVQ